jgi:hypothetical protein
MFVNRLWSSCIAVALIARSVAASPGDGNNARRVETPRIAVSLKFTDNPFSRGITTAAVAEAAAIWRPYGVNVEAIGTEEFRPVGQTRAHLAVVFRTHPFDHASRENALAGVPFDAEGNPAPRIEVYVDELQVMMETIDWLGIPLDRWPTGWWEEVTGRVLGRVLAHRDRPLCAAPAATRALRIDAAGASDERLHARILRRASAGELHEPPDREGSLRRSSSKGGDRLHDVECRPPDGIVCRRDVEKTAHRRWTVRADRGVSHVRWLSGHRPRPAFSYHADPTSWSSQTRR